MRTNTGIQFKKKSLSCDDNCQGRKVIQEFKNYQYLVRIRMYVYTIHVLKNTDEL